MNKTAAQQKSYGINDVAYKAVRGEKLDDNDYVIFQKADALDSLYAFEDCLQHVHKANVSFDGEVRSIPELLTAIEAYAPNALRKLGVGVEHFYNNFPEKYFERLGEKRKKEIVEKDTQIKRESNRRMNQDIIKSAFVKGKTSDYDMITDPQTIKEKAPEFGDEYIEIGVERIKAYQIARKIDSEIEQCLRIKETDGRPYAEENAKKLAELGIKTFNHDAGEKFTLILTFDVVPDFNKKIETMIEKSSLQNVSESTKIDKEKIEKIIGGKATFSHNNAKALERCYNRLLGTSEKLVVEKKISYNIFRDFFEDLETTTATLPQRHKIFSIMRTEIWDNLFDLERHHFDLCKHKTKEYSKS